MAETKKSPQSIVRTIYMYLVCLVAIVTFIIGSISAVNVTLKYYVFNLKAPQWEQSPELVCKETYKHPSRPVNDKGQFETPLTEEEIAACIETTSAQQLEQGKKEALNTLSWALAALLISLPIWMYHWRFIKK
jgi:hypothetical protein